MSNAPDPVPNGTAKPPDDCRGDGALRRSEARYRALVEASSRAVWSWSPGGVNTDFQNTMRWWEDVTGQTIAEQQRADAAWVDVVHPEDRETAGTAWDTARATGAPYDVEYRVRAKEGGWRYVRARGVPVPGPVGTVLEWVGTIEDVTAPRVADAARREGEERLRLALEASGTGVWEWNVVTGRITWSDQVHAFYGMRPGEFDGTLETFARHLHPGDAERAREAIRAAVEDDAPYQIEYRIVPKGGGVRWITTSGRVVRDAAGKPLRMIGATSDVTDRRRAEEGERRADARLRRLASAGIIGVIRWDLDLGLILDANDEFLRMTGYDRADLGAGKLNFRAMTPPEWTARNEAGVRELRETGVGGSYEKEYFRKDGSRVPVIIVGVRFEDAGAEGMSFVIDITERKRMEEALWDQDRKKDDFIALLAHELRNPLAPIRNGLQVVRLSADREVRERSQAMMDRQLGHMVRMIDDLLDVSRINRNKMELRRARVTLSDVIASAVETARPALDAEGHELTVALPQPPVALDADLTRLAQVFSNLLTNSAKYTPKGGSVWLSAERDRGSVRVTVRDTGIGIPKASLPAIFDMFSQVDRSVEKTTGGLGIGLALVKGLVEMHAGTVTAMSDGEGAGTTFTVTLPEADGADPSGPVTEDHARSRARRILVVDDNRDGAESMGDMLGLLGHEVTTAHDGLEAIERAEAFKPDVILMDVGMPRLNGLDATRRIRDMSWGRTIKVVALTGWGQDHDREQSQAAGCDAHLVKPVDFADLQRVLSEVVG